MATSAGQLLEAGRIPGERIATEIETSASSTASDSTEVLVQSVTAPVVSGRTYRVSFRGPITGSASGNIALGRIREDNTSGTELQNGGRIETATSSGAYPLNLEAEYTAGSTGDKTFVVTLARVGGSGTVNVDGASTRPAYLYVDYISG